MVKKMKLRFILTAVLALALTLSIAFGAVNFQLRRELTERTDYIIELIYENDGEFPKYEKYFYGLHSQVAYEIRYYVAVLNDKYEVIGLNSEYIYFPSTTELTEQLTDILRSDNSSGYIDDYRFGVFDSSFGKMVIVVDCRTDRLTNDLLLKITIFTVALCLIAVIVILFVLSGNMVRPFVKNREKQRRFITDAGHELKTPIAIISANAEVLEMTEGDNEWLGNIKNQTVRLNQLVKSLIELSKMDEEKKEEDTRQTISLSEIVSETVDSFAVCAEKEEIKIQTNIEPEVYITAYNEDIIRITGILIDNALKYADERKEIAVSVRRKGRKSILSVSNTCIGLDKKSIPHFFDRFYRDDSSRSRETGGYGIGLSMALAIATRNKGKINADYTADSRVVMTLEL